MNKGLISGAVLLSLGLICGLLLAVVNYFTAPIIAEQEKQVKYAALNDFYTVADYDVEEILLTGAIDTVFFFKNKESAVLEAAIYSVSAIGYSSDTPIQILIAIDPDLTINGYKVINANETAGFGDKVWTFDFGVTGDSINDLSNFDTIAGASDFTTPAVLSCFNAVQARVSVDFGGGN